MEQNTILTGPCKYCGSEIPTLADICHVCKSYRSSWKNYSLYIATLSGLLAVISTGAVFSIEKILEIKTMYTHNYDIALTYLETGTYPAAKISISNFGTDAIYLTDVSIYYGKAANVTYPINKEVEAQKTVYLDGDIFQSRTPNMRFIFANFASVEDIKLIVKYADLQIGGETLNCYHRVFYDKDNSNFIRMQKRAMIDKTSLVSDVASAVITYVSLRNGKKFRKKVDIVSSIMIINHSSCSLDSLKKALATIRS